MSNSILTLQSKRSESFFTSTYINVVLYWMMALFLVPVLLSILFSIGNDIISDLGFVLPTKEPTEAVLIKTAIWIIFGTQFFLGLIGHFHWRKGIEESHWIIISTAIFALVIFVPDILAMSANAQSSTPSLIDEFFEMDKDSFLRILEEVLTANKPINVFIAVWIAETNVLILTARKTPARLKNVLILINALAFIVILGISIDQKKPLLTVVPNVVWLFCSVAIITYAILRTLTRLRPSKLSFAFLMRFVSWLVILGGVLIFQFVGNEHPNINKSTTALVMVLIAEMLAVNPPRYWHSFPHRLRVLFLPLRRDRLYDISSPRIAPTNPINYFMRRWMPTYVRLSNRALMLTLCFLYGMLVIPYFVKTAQTGDSIETVEVKNSAEITETIETTDSEISIFDLIWLGTIATTVLSTTYLTIWLIATRSQYVVSLFEIQDPPESHNQELRAIANLITHMVVEELQQISILITTRQVENLNLAGTDSSAFFVTSGYSQKFIDEMQQVVNIEGPNGGAKFSLSEISAALVRFLARIRVSGKLLVRDNGTLDVWAELNYNSNYSAVNISIVPTNHLSELDGNALRPHIRQLALELILELGLLTHIGTRPDSLHLFLRGLEASVSKNWWEAEYYYREATRIEETYNDHFGVGHYHLGTSLIFQGNWRVGYDHLRKAEKDGPQMAETHYMLALVLFYAHWSDLHRFPAVFTEIEQHCKLATELRKDFPEAYHLWGMVLYRLARLIERTKTSRHKDSKTNREASFFQKQDYTWYYHRAFVLLRKALKKFRQQKPKIPRSPNYFNQAEMESNALLLQRMAIAHAVGDTLRSLRRHAEAETYYQDMLAAYPRDKQTLTDLSQLYCISELWQRGEEFLWRDVFSHVDMRWESQSNLNMATIVFGGLHSGKLKRLRKPLEKLVEFILNHSVNSYAAESKHFIHARGMSHLDYALLMRPRFISYWSRTDWAKYIRSKPLGRRNYRWPYFRLKEGDPSNVSNWIRFLDTVLFSVRKPDADEENTIDRPIKARYNYTTDIGVGWINYRIYMLRLEEKIPNRAGDRNPSSENQNTDENPDSLLDIIHSLKDNREKFVGYLRGIDRREGTLLLESIDNYEKICYLIDGWKNPEEGEQPLLYDQLGEEHHEMLCEIAKRLMNYERIVKANKRQNAEKLKDDSAESDKGKGETLPNRVLKKIERYLESVLEKRKRFLNRILERIDCFIRGILQKITKLGNWLIAFWKGVELNGPRSVEKTKNVATEFDAEIIEDLKRSAKSRNNDEIFGDFLAKVSRHTESSHDALQTPEGGEAALSHDTQQDPDEGDEVHSNETRQEEEAETTTCSNEMIIMTVRDRMITDLYNEMVIHIARGLAEAHRFYEMLILLADAKKQLVIWEELWKHMAQVEGEYYGFSPIVGEFHRATVSAWYAFASYLNKQEKNNVQNEKNTQEILADINDSLQRVPTHPIALLVNAWILRDRDEHERAIDLYNRILDVTMPNYPRLTTDPVYTEPDEHGGDKQREQFYFVERIAGQLQFSTYTSMWRIHAEMADTFLEMGRVDESTFHWAEAIRWSPYTDIDVKLLLRLSEVFIDAEKYDQALATARSANNLVHYLNYENGSDEEDSGYPVTIRYRPRLLETVALSRRNDFGEAINAAIVLVDELRNNTKWDGGMDGNIANNHEISTENRISILSYSNAETIEKQLNRLDSMQKELTKTCSNSTEESNPLDHVEAYYKFAEDIQNLLAPKDSYLLLEKNVLATCLKRPLAIILKTVNEENFSKMGVFSPRLSRLPKIPDEKDAYDAIHYLAGMADMFNVLAYSRAELRIPHRFNLIDIFNSLAILTFLFECAGGTRNTRNPFAYRLAQYFDTLSWMIFCNYKQIEVYSSDAFHPNDSPEELDRMLKLATRILYVALSYNANKAILEYHLAQIYMTRMDMQWDTDSASTREDRVKFSEYLSNALQHIHNARKLDKSNLLSTELTWSLKQLNNYREGLNNRHRAVE